MAAHTDKLPAHLDLSGGWKGKSLVSVEQLTPALLDQLFVLAMKMVELVKTSGGDDSLKGCVSANCFYEASTRTACSFAAAMQRLGGSVLTISSSSSSAKKGETLSDTIRCLQCYTDAVVLRHPTKGSVPDVASKVPKPVLNAGDGTGEHPTQALLDAFSIHRKLGAARLRKLKIAMIGDLKNGRTVHSLSRLLALFPEVDIHYVSVPELSMPDACVAEVEAAAKKFGSKVSQTSHGLEGMDEGAGVVSSVDVLYVTRIQKERFASLEAYEAAQGKLVVDLSVVSRMKEDAIVMHPLPRVGDITEEVDSDPRAHYFTQMEDGMYVRMALLRLLIKGE